MCWSNNNYDNQQILIISQQIENNISNNIFLPLLLYTNNEQKNINYICFNYAPLKPQQI